MVYFLLDKLKLDIQNLWYFNPTVKITELLKLLRKFLIKR